jgi:hypothetical protein
MSNGGFTGGAPTFSSDSFSFLQTTKNPSLA